MGGGLGLACTRLIREAGADRGDLVEVTVRLVDGGKKRRRSDEGIGPSVPQKLSFGCSILNLSP